MNSKVTNLHCQNNVHCKKCVSESCSSVSSPLNFVVCGDTLLHDFHQIVICVPAVDQQGLLHCHSQSQLSLKSLVEEEQRNKHIRLQAILFNNFSQLKFC